MVAGWGSVGGPAIVPAPPDGEVMMPALCIQCVFIDMMRSARAGASVTLTTPPAWAVFNDRKTFSAHVEAQHHRPEPRTGESILDAVKRFAHGHAHCGECRVIRGPEGGDR